MDLVLTANAIRASRTSGGEPVPTNSLRTSRDVRALRKRLTDAYPGLDSYVQVIQKAARRNSVFALIGELLPDSDLKLVEAQRADRATKELKDLEDQTEIRHEVLAAYAALCEEEARLAEIESERGSFIGA